MYIVCLTILENRNRVCRLLRYKSFSVFGPQDIGRRTYSNAAGSLGYSRSFSVAVIVETQSGDSISLLEICIYFIGLDQARDTRSDSLDLNFEFLLKSSSSQSYLGT